MRRLGIGVIGAGGIARRKTIPGMLKAINCQLVAVMDVAGAADIAREFGVPHSYNREADLLRDPDVEAVYIATPVHLHRQQIIAAAEHGKHVLCEKPLALTSSDAAAAVEACHKANVFLQEGYMMKFHGAHRAIKRLIDEGAVGRLVCMRAQAACWYPDIPGAWRQDPRTGGGGALFDMATHLYDLLEYFAGPIHRVAGFQRTLAHSYRSDDTSTTLLEFANGAQAMVDCCFSIPDQASRTRLEIYGTHGSLLSEGTIGQGTGGRLEGILNLGAATYDATQDKDGVQGFEQLPFEAVNTYTAECEYFAECVLSGRPPEINTGAQGVRVVRIAEMAYEACRTNRVLTVE